jgi:hypothetical protein
VTVEQVAEFAVAPVADHTARRNLHTERNTGRSMQPRQQHCLEPACCLTLKNIHHVILVPVFMMHINTIFIG